MDCNVAREALSARVDGEGEPVPGSRVDEHLASCADCRDWYALVIDQTQLLRRLAGRSHVAAVPAQREQPIGTKRLPALAGLPWQRVTLGLVGVAQLGVAVAQGLGANMGMPAGEHHALAAEHLMNESTAWSLALGVAMLGAALRPTIVAGLAAVLTVFTAVLAGYVISDATAGTVTVLRIISHLPVLAGTVLALLVWRQSRPGPGTADQSDEIVLPDHASRGRRRHLYPTGGAAQNPTDGSAA